MDSYSNYLLEFIAWRMAAGNKEFEDFRIWIRSNYDDASSIDSAEEIFRGLPALPDAREREMSADEQRKNGGVLIDTGAGTSPQKKKWLSKK